MKEQKKVFCRNCEYFVIPEDCIHPENLTDNWHQPDGYHHRKPEAINRNNNCKWYEEEKKHK